MSPPNLGLGSRLVRSSFWMLFNSTLGRILGIIAQLVLAGLLTKEEFGIYALAIAASAFLTNLRGAGMYQWMIQGGAEELERREGDTFWIGLSFNTAIGILIAALAVPLGTYADDSRLVPVLLTIGLSFPVTSVSGYCKACLSIDLRMREIALIEAVASALRASLMVAFAALGLGPLSFVLPLPIVYIVEGTLGLAILRRWPWRIRPNPRTWAYRIAGNRWILAGTLATTFALQADYVAIGALGSLETLGVYFFAYQLTFISASVVSESVRRVLFPGLVAVSVDQRAAASLRAVRLTVLVGSPALFLAAVTLPSLEPLLWDGKWAAAVLPVQVLSVALPFHVAATVTQASLQSSGRFRRWTALAVTRGLLIAGCAVSAMLLARDDMVMLAGLIALGYVLGAIVQVGSYARTVGVALRRLLKAILPGAAAASIAMVTALASTSHFISEDTVPLGRLTLTLAIFASSWLCLAFILDRKGTLDAWFSLQRALPSGSAANHS